MNDIEKKQKCKEVMSKVILLPDCYDGNKIIKSCSECDYYVRK